MGLIASIGRFLKKEPATPSDHNNKKQKNNKPRPPKPKPTAKELATQNGEPYINIIGIELDKDNVGLGSIELDWNDLFVAKLIKSGYKGKSEEDIIDQWFQDVCRNIVLETFEQFEANNPRPPTGVQRKNLGDGRTEVY